MSAHSPSQKFRRLTAAALTAGIAFTLHLTGPAGAGVTSQPLVVAAANASPRSAVVDPTLPANDAARGLVFDGMQRGRPDGPCARLLVLSVPGAAPSCTHGPDPAPAGVDVRIPRSVQDVALTTRATAQTTGTTGASVPCYGDGTTGNRIQAIYARSSDKPDRYADLASLFPQWAATADAVFNNSAAKTGGVRHLRWVTDPDCSLSVLRVTLSPTGDDNISNTESELQSLGIDRMDRKYMVWVDANVYCGVGDIRYDDQPGSGNMNNYGRSWARVDSGCWGYYDSPESHEIMHMLGGVQPTAPHASYAWHCTDESDRMCYSDGPVTMTYPCAGSAELLFDCGDDDYFHSAPSPTSYLGTHWNAAMNVFLEVTGPAPTTTTTPPPSTNTTSTWTGTLKGAALSKAYSVTSGAGTIVASATYSGGGANVTLTVKTAAGTVVGQTSGPSGVSMAVPVSAGSYTVTISGFKNTAYSMTATVPKP